MVDEEMVTVLTVLSDRPPTEPMERPCPPEQVPPVKMILVPELMARQSSWFWMLALVMVTPVEDPTSKASVLCPWEVPAELSITISVTARVVTELMLMS